MPAAEPYREWRDPVLLAVAARVIGEATAWLPLPISVRPDRIATAVALGLLITALTQARRALSRPLGSAFALLALWLGLCALRAPTLSAGLWDFLRYFSPLLVLWLAEALPAPPWRRLSALTWVALVPAALALGHRLILGADSVRHGFSRTYWPYPAEHDLAYVMAIAAAAALVSLRNEPRLRTVLPLLIVLPVLGFTWVRGAWLFASISVLVALGVQRPWLATGTTVTTIAVMPFIPALRARWADLYAILTWTPPPHGWAALGSYRGVIWGGTLTLWLQHDWRDWLFGMGLGNQVHFRNLDAHSMPLAVWMQTGLPGLLAWVAGFACLLVIGWRHRLAPAAQALLGLSAAAFFADLTSNALLPRPSASWMLALALGSLLQALRPAPRSAG